MNGSRAQAGYSLAEMLVVVAIIGVMTLVTIPAFLTFYESNKAKASMRNFTSDLRRVRQLAITSGRQTKLSYVSGSGKRLYTIAIDNDPTAPKGSADTTTAHWKAVNGAGLTPNRSLDTVMYFPTHAAGTAPQTFTDVDGDASVDLDVIFFPDGTAFIPTHTTDTAECTGCSAVTIKTDLKRVSKKIYIITVSPAGRVLAQ